MVYDIFQFLCPLKPEMSVLLRLQLDSSGPSKTFLENQKLFVREGQYLF